ncbi:MAG: hypothetical protein GY910_19340 [bacterium]|nr:hypothetical protein [Deltaproteobacteria bacterium]MCP4907135.1 hypothetical protein [bacterium]
MENDTLISADCHAAPKLDDARAYVDPERRADDGRWREALAKRDAERLGEPLFAEEARDDFQDESKVAAGGMDGIWDPERRTAEQWESERIRRPTTTPAPAR